jgi:hypothetical protein
MWEQEPSPVETDRNGVLSVKVQGHGTTLQTLYDGGVLRKPLDMMWVLAYSAPEFV